MKKSFLIIILFLGVFLLKCGLDNIKNAPYFYLGDGNINDNESSVFVKFSAVQDVTHLRAIISFFDSSPMEIIKEIVFEYTSDEFVLVEIPISERQYLLVLEAYNGVPPLPDQELDPAVELRYTGMATFTLDDPEIIPEVDILMIEETEDPEFTIIEEIEGTISVDADWRCKPELIEITVDQPVYVTYDDDGNIDEITIMMAAGSTLHIYVATTDCEDSEIGFELLEASGGYLLIAQTHAAYVAPDYDPGSAQIAVNVTVPDTDFIWEEILNVHIFAMPQPPLPELHPEPPLPELHIDVPGEPDVLEEELDIDEPGVPDEPEELEIDEPGIPDVPEEQLDIDEPGVPDEPWVLY